MGQDQYKNIKLFMPSLLRKVKVNLVYIAGTGIGSSSVARAWA